MEWTVDDLSRALAQMRARRGDSTSIEVKRATGGVPRMPETLCAFANMPNGGTVIFGVEEGTGEFSVVGVTNIAELEAGIVSMARDAVHPVPQISFQTIEMNARNVVIAHIAPLPLADKPARVAGRAFLRQADGDYPMHPHEEHMIEVARLRSDEQVNYDLAPARGRSHDDLDKALTSAYVLAVRSHDRRLRDFDDLQILRMTNVLTASGEPTLAGLYALGTYPQGQYPALTVTAAVQLKGGEGQPRNRNLQDFTGPLPILLTDLLDWVASNLDRVNQYRDNGHMEVVSELPLNAVRELLANALVHRDLGPNTLGTGKQIQVRLTPRNLFIQNPGGLRGVSLAQIESVEHAQAAVNQRLYQIAKRLATPDGASIIEGEGGGIREVFRSVEARGLTRPQFIDTGVQFKALLWRDRATSVNTSVDASPHKNNTVVVPRSSSPTRNEHRTLAALAATANPMTIHELVGATDMTIGQIRYALARPLADGIVVMDGKQGLKSTRYRLK